MAPPRRVTMVTLAAVLLLLVIQFGPPRKLFDQIMSTPDGTFAEFYFDNPDALPTRHSGMGPVHFDVGIANHFSSARTFHWAVVTKSSAGEVKQPGGTVDVGPDETQTLGVSVNLQPVTGLQRITVRLEEQELEISLLVDQRP